MRVNPGRRPGSRQTIGDVDPLLNLEQFQASRAIAGIGDLGMTAFPATGIADEIQPYPVDPAVFAGTKLLQPRGEQRQLLPAPGEMGRADASDLRRNRRTRCHHRHRIGKFLPSCRSAEGVEGQKHPESLLLQSRNRPAMGRGENVRDMSLMQSLNGLPKASAFHAIDARARFRLQSGFRRDGQAEEKACREQNQDTGNREVIGGPARRHLCRRHTFLPWESRGKGQ